MKLKLHLKSKDALVLRSVTHTKQRPKHAQTAGDSGARRAQHDSRQKTTKETKMQ